MGWSSVKVRGRLMLDGKEYDTVMATVSYELNNIPQATFLVAVGRGGGQLKPAAIHRLQPKAQMPVLFYATLEQQSGTADRELPKGELLLFEGELTGLSFQKMSGGAQVVLQARHWLLNMDYSSSLSESSHPANPSQFSYRATHEFKGAGAASWGPFTRQGLISEITLAEDFWGKGLYPWLQELTDTDRINKDELSFLGGGDTGNTSAKKALNRFTTTKGNYVPLEFDMRKADAGSVAAAIWNDVQAETYESFAQVTLWGKLVSDFASRYMFAVVPRVSDALVIPYIPGLRKLWTQKLRATDYVAVAVTSELHRTLRGVGVFSGVASRTGADGREPGQDTAKLGVGGWYSPPGADTGMVMLRSGPRWLTGIIAPDRYSEFSTGGGMRKIGNAMHPGEKSTGQSTAGSPPPSPASLKESSKPVFDAYAEALYAYEQLRLRQIEISGKLRFDIAPGSTTELEVSGEKFISNDALSGNLIGDVLRVTYVMDSENGKAATNFNLAHLRTEQENQLPGFSLDRHPLWKQPWSGCRLVD